MTNNLKKHGISNISVQILQHFFYPRSLIQGTFCASPGLMDTFQAVSFGQTETLYVVSVLILLFLIGIVSLIVRTRRDSNQARIMVSGMPSILSTVGVFGTFFGIWVGLQDFDVTAIDQSVPTLLEGLKTAFVTSLWGMALSVLFRLIINLTPAKSNGTGSVLEALKTLINEQQSSNEVLKAKLEDVRQAIAGDNDNALGTQIGKLRNELRDSIGDLRKDATEQHEEHLKVLQDFSNHMVENTNKTLVEALQEVIRDFNNQLTEQFGENFKQLNSAVKSLVTWQDNYRVHVDEMQSRIEVAVNGLQSSATSLESVNQSVSAIPTAINELEPTLETITICLDRINKDLEAYSDLHDKACSAFPVIRENLENMTSGLKSSIGEIINTTGIALDQQRDAHGALENGYKKMLTSSEEAQSTYSQAVEKTMDLVGNELTKSTDRMKQSLEESFTDTDRKLKAQIEKVDTNLGNELEKALGMMSNNLGSMSDKFVKDYAPLTQQLQDIVNLAKAANDRGPNSRVG